MSTTKVNFVAPLIHGNKMWNFVAPLIRGNKMYRNWWIVWNLGKRSETAKLLFCTELSKTASPVSIVNAHMSKLIFFKSLLWQIESTRIFTKQVTVQKKLENLEKILSGRDNFYCSCGYQAC